MCASCVVELLLDPFRHDIRADLEPARDTVELGFGKLAGRNIRIGVAAPGVIARHGEAAARSSNMRSTGAAAAAAAYAELVSSKPSRMSCMAVSGLPRLFRTGCPSAWRGIWS